MSILSFFLPRATKLEKLCRLCNLLSAQQRAEANGTATFKFYQNTYQTCSVRLMKDDPWFRRRLPRRCENRLYTGQLADFFDISMKQADFIFGWEPDKNAAYIESQLDKVRPLMNAEAARLADAS